MCRVKLSPGIESQEWKSGSWKAASVEYLRLYRSALCKGEIISSSASYMDDVVHMKCFDNFELRNGWVLYFELRDRQYISLHVVKNFRVI